MRVELVMIGTELLLGDTVDTNASYLAEGLARHGIDLYYKSTVGDNWLRLIEVLSQALSRSDLVITSGGLGPTMDDLTREAAAAVTNCPLERNEEAEALMEAFFQRLGRTMTQNNRKQAYLPRGAQAIPNSWGTAPGILWEMHGKTLICLPGVPRELKGMFEETVLPYLRAHSEGQVLVSRTLHFAGIGESQLEEEIRDILLEQGNPTVAPYASFGMVKLRITAKAPSELQARQLIAPVERQLRKRVGEFVYAVDGELLEEVVGRLLRGRGETVTSAESCTGGLIAHRITDVAGSSDYFERGFVTYSNAAKVQDLGVRSSTLEAFGAVSEECVREMAAGVRRHSDADWGLAVTGIAGPGGGTDEKPVGLVYMAVASAKETVTERHQFQGSRSDIKFRVAQAALNLLRRQLQ